MWAQAKQHTKPQLTRREAKQLWPEARQVLEFLGKSLPKQRLIRAIGIMSDERKRRFTRRRQPKYGSMNKGFEEDELIAFMNHVEDPKFALIFSYQAILGLRIGEAVRIHIRDINLKTKELRIDTEKGKRTDYLPIPQELFDRTLQFIGDWEDEIMKRKGFVFWAEHYPKRNKCPHVAPQYARNVFTKAIKKAGLDETYGYSEGGKPKLLRRLTTQSLRHYAITNHARKSNGNVVLTSRFARHSDVDTTTTYIHTDKQELYTSVRGAASSHLLNYVLRMQEAF